MKLDVYRGTTDTTLRMYVEEGAGLPGHVLASEWALLPEKDWGQSEFAMAYDDDVAADIEGRGFSLIKLA